LRLADQGILDGVVGPMTIEALDRRSLQLELGSEIVSSLSRLMAFVEQPANTLPYEIHGVVTLDRRLRRLPFDERGQVPLVLTSER
jgi:murein L,D-transpeptidase YcbB/YkuD